MPEMSLSEAALWAGKGRPAILKSIQKGTLSARKDEAGQWRIEPSELARVYPPGHRPDVSRDVSRVELDIGEAIAGKDRELALMRELVTAAEGRAAELAQDRDHWRQQAEAQTRLLTHQQTPPEATPEPRRGLLARFTGR